MTTKHINEKTWETVKEATVNAVKVTNQPIRDTVVLNLLILKGLEQIKEKDYQNLVNKDSQKWE